MAPPLISLLSVLYLVSVVLLAVIANIYPLLDHARDIPEEDEVMIRVANGNKAIEEERGLMVAVFANHAFVFIIGGLGNLLTLIAIPYVRTRYRQEFSILQLNSVILLLHLSFVDFLFALVWIFYNLEVYFWEGAGQGSLCFLRRIAAKLIVYAEFNTLPLVACCVARHNMFRETSGATFTQDTQDKIFGGTRVFIVCLAIWFLSAFSVLPDFIVIREYNNCAWWLQLYLLTQKRFQSYWTHHDRQQHQLHDFILCSHGLQSLQETYSGVWK